MEAKRSQPQSYLANGHRANVVPQSKTNVNKNASEVSLTPSQAVEHAKSNGRKHPLDALSKLSIKQSTVERRSGLQDVDDDYLKQNIFRKPLFARNSGLSDNYGAQNQNQNQPAAGLYTIPPSEGIPANFTTQQQQNQQQQQQQP